ncbi:S1 family peptidase [Bradyrhizobium brasilense]|uniref:hypothetical protein n=1 Tax=Bradyrhizobium brasilense TaxID=1419277 RepID=UPI002877FAE5|nr:hypothetical protein [Bradyrhizobium brasilense]MCP3417898.1 S1 family peptidase [Bradyrhizobium brasilense]
MVIDEKPFRDALELLSADDVLLPEGFSPDATHIVRTARAWTSASRVVGFGIGEKVTKGKKSGTLALKIYVAEKLPLYRIEDAERAPEVNIPDIAKGLPTDVEAIGILKEELLALKERPLIPGYSIGNIEENTGTLGCIATPRGGGDDLILSNSHILARYGLAPVGDAIIQPGRDDGGGGADAVATLVKFSPFDFGSGFPNTCDAAVAKVQQGIAISPAIAQIGMVTGINASLQRGMQVQKTGRTTDHTIGTILDINFRFKIPYPNPAANGERTPLGFRDQVRCSRYTDGGDSGSLVCDMNGKAVGLHFVGSDSVSVFSPIQFVLDALAIELRTQ